jgi:hypothetical protein
VLLAASAVADLAAASMLNAYVISAMSEAALDLLTQDKVVVAHWQRRHGGADPCGTGRRPARCRGVAHQVNRLQLLLML